jgi:hypothetical protein
MWQATSRAQAGKGGGHWTNEALRVPQSLPLVVLVNLPLATRNITWMMETVSFRYRGRCLRYRDNITSIRTTIGLTFFRSIKPCFCGTRPPSKECSPFLKRKTLGLTVPVTSNLSSCPATLQNSFGASFLFYMHCQSILPLDFMGN